MKPIIVFAAMAASTPALAIDMPLKLRDGATWTITAAHTRTQTDDATSQAWTLTTTKQLTWRAPKGGAPAQLVVTPVSAVAAEGSPPGLARSRSLSIPATIEVDETLAPLGIVNLAEVRTAFADLVGEDITGQEARADASALAMIASELGMTSRAQGGELEAGTPLEYEGELANPLGGPPIRSVGTFELESHDPTAGRAVMHWRQVIDKEAFKASLAQGLQAAIKADPTRRKEAEAVFAAMDVDRQDRCRHEVDLASGLAVKSECALTNRVVAGGRTVEVVDRWTITQTLPRTTP